MACECAQKASIYLPKAATILQSRPMTELERLFEIRLEGQDLNHLPGQFVEVSIPGAGEAPFSICSSPTQKGSFEMVIRKVGMLTDAIHKMSSGDPIGIRGPFGTHFPMEDAKGKDLLFIAGGIGLVPLLSAIRYAMDCRKDYGRIVILFGSRDPSQRLFRDELKDWGGRNDVEFMETVDRGDASWKGHVGVITTILPQVKNLNPANTKAFLVGPPVMYKFVIMELRNNLHFKDQDVVVSLERRMKCGVGKCGHCQINGVYVCQDGPVFALDAITHLTEAI